MSDSNHSEIPKSSPELSDSDVDRIYDLYTALCDWIGSKDPGIARRVLAMLDGEAKPAPAEPRRPSAKWTGKPGFQALEVGHFKALAWERGGFWEVLAKDDETTATLEMDATGNGLESAKLAAEDALKRLLMGALEELGP